MPTDSSAVDLSGASQGTVSPELLAAEEKGYLQTQAFYEQQQRWGNPLPESPENPDRDATLTGDLRADYILNVSGLANHVLGALPLAANAIAYGASDEQLQRLENLSDEEGRWFLKRTAESVAMNAVWGAGARFATTEPAKEFAAETGVNPNILSGHGALIVGDSSPVTVLPPGTSLTFWTEHGQPISDALGNAIETGGQVTIEQFPRAAGARSYLPGSVVPNYTLYPPTGLNILGNPTTVTSPTRLGDLLMSGMGNVNWAACRSVIVP